MIMSIKNSKTKDHIKKFFIPKEGDSYRILPQPTSADIHRGCLPQLARPTRFSHREHMVDTFKYLGDIIRIKKLAVDDRELYLKEVLIYAKRR